MFRCDVCRGPNGKGLHRHDGHRLVLYGDLVVCDLCWIGNHDGWTPDYEPILLDHLERIGLPVPERNAKGLLPRG